MQTIRNDTPDILILHGADDQQLTLAPLERRTVPDLAGFDLESARRAALVHTWSEPPGDTLDKLFTTFLGLGVMLAIACGVVAGREPWFGPAEHWTRNVWLGGALILGLSVVGRVIYLTRSLQIVLRFLSQLVSLLVVLAIGLGMPLASAYYFGDGPELIGSPANKEALFARLLQVGFIATASLLPALLYFLFDRYRLSTLRDRLYADMFRLDRSLRTRSEIDAKYGGQILEAFGPEDQGRGRLARGSRWPVLVCVFIISTGWLAVFLPVGKVEGEVRDLLFPAASVPTFGFLGAYFFGLRLIARRYSRGDLKPKAYGFIAIRILTVAILSWVLQAVFSEDGTLVLLAAFLIGIVPDEFFTLLKEKTRGKATSRLVPETERHPLTRLEGIDLYDRARLEQEGIVNVESLAHHDLIHLVLETRIPVPRLVDWMDQAILYLHIIQEPEDDTRNRLRQYGIRTTTDLLAAWEAAAARGTADLQAFKRLLGDDQPPYRLEVIRDALLDDEWLDRIQDWRLDSPPAERHLQAVPQSFEAKLAWAHELEADGRLKEAIQTLQEALEIRDRAEAHVALASLYATAAVPSLRDRDRSRRHAQRALELGRDQLEVVLPLILVFEANDELGDALRACDIALRLIGPAKGDRRKQEQLATVEKARKDLVARQAQSSHDGAGSTGG